MLHAALLLWVAGAGPPAPRERRPARDGWLLVGSIPGVLIGSHLSVRVPERALRIAFAFVLVLSGIKLVEAPAGDDDHRGLPRRSVRWLSSSGCRRCSCARRRLAPAARLNDRRRIARAWPGSCRRRSSSPCSRRLLRPSRSPRAPSSSKSPIDGDARRPGLLARQRRSGEEGRAHAVPRCGRASASTSGSRTARRPRRRRCCSTGRSVAARESCRLVWDGFTPSGDRAAGRRVHARSSSSSGRTARSCCRARSVSTRRRRVITVKRPAVPDHLAGRRRPPRRRSAIHYEVNEPAQRDPRSCAARSVVFTNGQKTSGELVWNGKVKNSQGKSCAPAGPVRLDDRGARHAPATSPRACPFAIAQVRYVTVARHARGRAPGRPVRAARVDRRAAGRAGACTAAAGVQRAGTLHFRAPKSAGVYRLYISVAGHAVRTTVVVA